MLSKRFFPAGCLVWALLAISAPAHAQTPNLENLDKRLKALEKRSSRSTTPDQRSVRSFLNTQVQLGGFFESVMTSFSQSGRDTQLGVAGNILGLNLSAEFSDDLRFTTQFFNFLNVPLQNPNSDPNAVTAGLPRRAEFGTYTYGTLLTQGYVEWASSPGFILAGGMGYVPYGIAPQNLEPVLFVRRGGPQIIRVADLVFPLWEGVHAHGAFPIAGGSRWGYHFYTFTGLSNAKIPGTGYRVWWKSPREAVSAGLSSQVFKRGQLTAHTVGADVRVMAGPWTFTHEAAKSNGAGAQPWSAYFQTDYAIEDEEWIFYIFGDYLDHPNNQTAMQAALPDPFRKWEYGGGVNWLPTSFTRFRLGLLLGNYVGPNAEPQGQSRDYWGIEASAGVAF